MKIIVAPDSFKGSISAAQAADAMEKGILKVYPDAEVVKLPVADGGEGTVDALVSGMGGVMRRVCVTDPLGNKIDASYGLVGDDAAIIEMAAASGLTLVAPESRNPLVTTSFGTGELIKDALEMGCRKIVIGIGGSATNDGGIGMAQALGVSFKDEAGNELGFGGGCLGLLKTIDMSHVNPLLKDCEIITACDVTNPLCGETGSSVVYGPQKGATPDMVCRLDDNLKHYAGVIKEQLGDDIACVAGAGAAGGMGAALMVFCKAQLKSGIQIVLDLVDIDTHMASADLVITGEGRIDGQSAYGKVPVGVGLRAKKYGVPVVVIAGSIGDGASAVYDCGIDAVMSIADGPMPLHEAMDKAADLLQAAAQRAMRLIRIGTAMERGKDNEQ